MNEISRQLIKIGKVIEFNELIKQNIEYLNNIKINVTQLCKILNIDKKTYYNNIGEINYLLHQINCFVIKDNKIDYNNLIKTHLKQLKDKWLTISQLCEILNISNDSYYRNYEEINNLLNITNTKIIKKNLETLFFIHKNQLKDKQLTISQLCEILNISTATYRKNKDKIKKYIQIYNIEIIRKPNNKKLLQFNKKLLQNKQLTIVDVCKILNISQSFFSQHKKEIQDILNNYNTKIIRKRKNYTQTIINKSDLLKNKKITLTELCKILNISTTAFFKNKNEIIKALRILNTEIIKEISILQAEFAKKVQLQNVKIIYQNISLDYNLSNHLTDCIIKIKNIFKKENTMKNNLITSSKNNLTKDKRLNNLLNYLNKHLNNLKKTPFDFYIETKNGNKYLIQCQGEQHYILNCGWIKNPITRILIDAAKMLAACKYNCNFIATYDVKTKKKIKNSLDVFNDFYMTTEEAIQLIKNEGTVDKYKIKRCAITMINRIRKKFEDRIDQLSQKIKGQKKTNREILEQIRKY